MYKVKSTYSVLGARALQTDRAEDWIDWALEMLVAGYETEHLIMLAGLSPHLNRFEFEDVVNRALKELTLDTVPKQEAVDGYVYYLIIQSLAARTSTEVALRILRDLCQKNDYDPDLMDFYFLAYAVEELKDMGVQYYYDGANKNNIETIVQGKFLEWKNKYESAIRSSIDNLLSE